MEDLVRLGYITKQQFEHAKKYQSKHACKIGEALLDLGYVNGRMMAAYVKRIVGY
jgi:hypothetical protein